MPNPLLFLLLSCVYLHDRPVTVQKSRFNTHRGIGGLTGGALELRTADVNNRNDDEHSRMLSTNFSASLHINVI